MKNFSLLLISFVITSCASMNEPEMIPSKDDLGDLNFKHEELKEEISELKKELKTTQQELKANQEKKSISAEEIAEKVIPSIVFIITSSKKGIFTGTGFFISPTKLVTNYHVIDGATKIAFRKIHEKETYFIDRVLVFDKENDLAILDARINSLNYLNVKSSIDIKLGQKIFVAGNPKELIGTFSDGVISNIAQEKNILQISAPISHGSSGSPILDASGDVIGIVTSGVETGQNLNFGTMSDSLINLDNSIESKDERFQNTSESTNNECNEENTGAMYSEFLTYYKEGKYEEAYIHFSKPLTKCYESFSNENKARYFNGFATAAYKLGKFDMCIEILNEIKSAPFYDSYSDSLKRIIKHNEKLCRNSANEFYKKTCKLGDLSSCSILQFLEGTTKPICTSSDLLSCAILAMITEEKVPLINTKKVYSYACDSGEMRACNRLGVIEENSGNPYKAQALFLKACSEGLPLACNNVGANAYASGNITEARKQYQRACDQGLMLSCSNLGLLESNQSNQIRARELYLQACESGESEGCLNLGLLNKMENTSDADKYLKRACIQENKEACDVLDQGSQNLQ